MSKIHILKSDNNQSYEIAIHFATPAGNNTVGFSWKSCGLACGMTGTTSLEVGTEPSNITQSEYDDIIAGNVIEIVRSVTVGTSPTNAMVEQLADIYISEYQNDVAKVLKYFGHTIEES
uniref:Uncharacterized protein n=1 Tax=viral metagenome TaxID=1070528 RepID=A0A6M3M1I9_9ZZZZ